MKTLQISKVSVINNNKEGKTINIVVVRVAGKPAIVRSFDQFLTDLRESFLVPANVTSMNDPQVLDVLADLRGGTVSGMVSFHKAGDKYKIDERHSAITNPNHRLYGKVSIGDELAAEKDGARVTEGFLTLKREMAAQAIHKSANSYATQRLALEGFLNSIGSSSTTTESTPEVEDFDVDEEVIKTEVVGEEVK